MSNRASPALQIVRQFLVRALASSGEPTVNIAATLGLSRSFTIKQAHIALKPRNAAERRILKVANEHRAKLQRMGISGLLGGEDIVTTLAGGERPKLGPLAERRAKREKAEKKTAKKPTPKKSAPKKAPTKAPEKKAPKPKDPPKAAPKQKAPPKAKSNAAAKAAETRAAKKPKEKVPAAAPETKPEGKPAAPDPVAATIEDLLGDEAPAPDAPV